MDRGAVHQEMELARASFQELWLRAGSDDLTRRSEGTAWTNQQLLFHMLFGYLIMRALINLVRLFGRLPDGVGRRFAGLLNAATGPFDAINYLGSRVGGTTLGQRGQTALFDRVTNALHRRLDAESEDDLARGMYYPSRWDPFFEDYMTLADVYRFPTRHFNFHRDQLTLDAGR